MKDTINHLKLDKEAGLRLLRAYVYGDAKQQRDVFVLAGNTEQARRWNGIMEKAFTADANELIELVLAETTGDDPIDACWTVYEAMCSFRPDQYRNVERDLYDVKER